MNKLLALTVAVCLGIAAPASAAPKKPPFQYLPNRNFTERPNQETPSVIVLHDTEDANLERVLRLFRSRSFGNNAHFVIAKDGKIYQTAPLSMNAGHAGKSRFKGRNRVNDFSIGIELINRGNGRDPFPEAQYRSLARLVAWLCHKYSIDWSHVTTHSEVAIPRGRKSDPRPPFSMSKLHRMVGKL
jgi:N-acetylmuramoyl-L-alanine amidase